MGLNYGLFEERVVDPTTGGMLNPDMEWYKLAGAADIPEIIVARLRARRAEGARRHRRRRAADDLHRRRHRQRRGQRHRRPGARVADDPPQRPERPGHGIQRRESVSLMKAFEYAAPTSVEDAVKLLGTPDAAALSGGTDLISRMKDYVTSPARVVYLKDIKALAGISGEPKAGGLKIGAGTRLADIVAHAGIKEAYPGALASDPRGRLAPDPQHEHRRRQPAPASPMLVLSAPASACWA